MNVYGGYIKQEETSMRPTVHYVRHPLRHIDHGDLSFPNFQCSRSVLLVYFSSGVGLHSAFRYFPFGLT